MDESVKGAGSSVEVGLSRGTGVLPAWLWAFLEIVAVALFGSLGAQGLFVLAGWSGAQILSEARLVFAFMSLEASLTLVLIGAFLRFRGPGVRRLGWDWRGWQRELGVGVAFLPVLFAATLLVKGIFFLFFPQWLSTSNPLLDIIDSPGALALFLISSFYVGGFKEEVQRAFVLDRFEHDLAPLLGWLLGPGPRAAQLSRRLALAAGLLLWSLFFGVGHLMQGVDNAVGAGLLGLLFGLLFLWRRKLLAPMVAHSLFDVVTLLIFWTGSVGAGG